MAQTSVLYALCLVCLVTAEGRIMPAARVDSVNVAAKNTTSLLSSSNPRLCSSSYSCSPPSYTRNSSPSISATDFIIVPTDKKIIKLPKILLRFVLPPSVIGIAAVGTICICCRRKKKPAAAETAADASGDAKPAEEI